MNLQGIGVSPGIVIGQAMVLKKFEPLTTGILVEQEDLKQLEIEKFDQAVALSVTEVESLRQNSDLGLSTNDTDILETHIEFLTDPEIRDNVVAKIIDENKNVNDSVIEVIDSMVQLFLSIDDEYMSARSSDIKDIGLRILKHLHPSTSNADIVFKKDTILIAEDIAPSDSITLNLKLVIGFATQLGGKTSHTAIIARSRGVPAVVGCGPGLQNIHDDDLIILDGEKGVILVNPENNVVNEYKMKQQEYARQLAFLKSLKDSKPVTSDGHSVKLFANISSISDLDCLSEFGAEGVGLLRTEMLFMERDSLPSEDEQYSFYKQIAIKSKNVPVTIRTLDIGGDKPLPYFGNFNEKNPFLGYRAIRICLDRKDIFLTQLKAILRASPYGNLKIMFPMISNVQELREAKQLVEKAKHELKESGVDFDKNIEVGVMIEVPSAAITADILAAEVDFFSIGTNDLCQYTLAVDRLNEKISSLYDPYNPAILRLIQNVIEQAHKKKIHVGMCGELASDPLATRLLLAMGLDEFSMSPAAIPHIKNCIINSSIVNARKLLEQVMTKDNSQSIIQYLQEEMK